MKEISWQEGTVVKKSAEEVNCSCFFCLAFDLGLAGHEFELSVRLLALNLLFTLQVYTECGLYTVTELLASALRVQISYFFSLHQI